MVSFMKIFKMNGLGNSFAIFDARQRAALNLSPSQARAIADPIDGIGCDQVIVMEPSPLGAARMRIWNADGGEVAACGNATRCVAWLLMEEDGGLATRIETDAGVLEAERRGPQEICVDMGPPGLSWSQIPLSEPRDTRSLDIMLGDVAAPLAANPAAVSMGNPHCVFFVEGVERFPVERLGRMMERHPLFPERVNVGFAEVQSDTRLRLRVWERGAGLTKACGTGACAALVAAARRGLSARSAQVMLDGGALTIDWSERDNRVRMTGPVELEFATDMTRETA